VSEVAGGKRDSHRTFGKQKCNCITPLPPGAKQHKGEGVARSAASPRHTDDQKTRPADFSIFHNFTTAVY